MRRGGEKTRVSSWAGASSKEQPQGTAAAPRHCCSPRAPPQPQLLLHPGWMCCPGALLAGVGSQAVLCALCCQQQLDLPGQVCRGCRQEPEQAAAPRERSGRLRLHPGWRQPLLHLHSVIFMEPAQPVVVTGGLPQGCWACGGNTEALAVQILVAFQ